MKTVGIVLLVIIIFVGAVIYYFRYDIFQYSAERIIKDKLPPYVAVDRIIFDLKNNQMVIKNLAIKNPESFSHKFLAKIGEITCRYRMKGANVLDGIEVTEITAAEPAIEIERLSNGKVNVTQMSEVMAAPKQITSDPGSAARLATVADPGSAPVAMKDSSFSRNIMGKRISDLVKLPSTINIEDGRILFTDRFGQADAYELTFENINASLNLVLNEDYTQVLAVASQGEGLLNGDMPQRISWVISLEPTASALTMSNRFEVKNIDITLLEPYYGPYSPIIIHTGRASGTLVFDFDHGNIGSTNTLVVKGLRFREKGGGGTYGWETTSVSEIIRYLESAPDEVTFDFKIKGTIDDPHFYPGPYVKQAIQNMVVDKVGQTLQQFTKEGEDGGSDAGKVVDAIKGFLGR